MTLQARLRRIEDMEGKMNPQQQYRFCRLAADDDEEAVARQEIVDLGCDPDTDLLLIRLMPLDAGETIQ